MMCDDHLLAPVVSEPALPFVNDRAIGLSDSEITTVREKIAKGGQLAAFRFVGDPHSPAARANLLCELVQGAAPKNSPALRGSMWLQPTCPNAHSVFTAHFDERPGTSTTWAMDELKSFLRDRLR